MRAPQSAAKGAPTRGVPAVHYTPLAATHAWYPGSSAHSDLVHKFMSVKSTSVATVAEQCQIVTVRAHTCTSTLELITYVQDPTTVSHLTTESVQPGSRIRTSEFVTENATR